LFVLKCDQTKIRPRLASFAEAFQRHSVCWPWPRSEYRTSDLSCVIYVAEFVKQLLQPVVTC